MRAILLPFAVLSVCTGLADAAQAACTKNEVLKLIEKGFDKKAIEALCAGSAAPAQEAPAQPAAPATDAVSVIGALLKLVERPPLGNNEQLDKSFAALGLSFSKQDDFRRRYEGVLTDIGVKASASVGSNGGHFELNDSAPARTTSLKDKYYMALKAAQIFAAQHGWSLSDEQKPSRALPCPQREFGSEKKTASGADGEIIVSYNLGSMIPRYSCDDGSPKDADAYTDGNFVLVYDWTRR